MAKKAVHAGAFFEAIGVEFEDLGRADRVVSADFPDAWFPPSPRVLEKLKASLPFLLRTSPPAGAEGLIAVLSEVRGVPRESILPAGGSSELIFNAVPNLVSRDDTVLLLDPMYGEYRHVCEAVAGARTSSFYAPKGDAFAPNISKLIEMIDRLKPKLVIIVNPSNPTGYCLPANALLRVAESLPHDACLFVDETYLEFAGQGLSLEKEVLTHPNLLVLKSMSKVYALSGLRVGYLVANPAWIDRFALTIPPWAVGFLAQLAAIEALRDPAYYQERYAETRRMRRGMAERLQIMRGLRVYDSTTNFFLVEITDEPWTSQAVVERLRDDQIYVRECSSISPQFGEKFLRIAVKTPEHNERVLQGLQSMFPASC